MAELKERLRADLNAAMRARDQVRMRTLRMALTSITNEEVAGDSARSLSDGEIVKVLTREARKRREAAEAFGAAGREEQAAAERAEGEVLADYLPAQLSDDELAALVSAAIAETGASGMQGMGQVMKLLTPRVAGGPTVPASPPRFAATSVLPRSGRLRCGGRAGSGRAHHEGSQGTRVAGRVEQAGLVIAQLKLAPVRRSRIR